MTFTSADQRIFLSLVFVVLLRFVPDVLPAETSTVFSINWNVGGSVQQNGTSFSQSGNMTAGGVPSITASPGTSRQPTAGTSRSTASSSPTSTTKAAQSPTSSSSSLEMMKYGLVLSLNAVCIFFQLYVSIFGRRMRMSGLRWFTLYYNLWNCYQLILISDTAEGSPWRGWLGDSRLLANLPSLELFTMSFFPLGVVLLLPLLLISHFCFCCQLGWLFWVPLFLLCSLLPTLLYNGQIGFISPVAKGNLSIVMGNGTNSVDMFEAYAFTCASLAALSTLYLIPMVFVALFCFLCYRLLNRFNPKSDHPLRLSRIVDLLLLLPFLLIVLAAHFPTFIVNLSGFFIVNVYPTLSETILPLLTGPKPAVAGANTTTKVTPLPISPLSIGWMMDVLNAYNQILLWKDDCELFLPEQYIALLSCYACYKDDKEGAGVLCCFHKRKPLGTASVSPMPVAHPQDPRLWAQPVNK